MKAISNVITKYPACVKIYNNIIDRKNSEFTFTVTNAK